MSPVKPVATKADLICCRTQRRFPWWKFLYMLVKKTQFADEDHEHENFISARVSLRVIESHRVCALRHTSC